MAESRLRRWIATQLFLLRSRARLWRIDRQQRRLARLERQMDNCRLELTALGIGRQGAAAQLEQLARLLAEVVPNGEPGGLDAAKVLSGLVIHQSDVLSDLLARQLKKRASLVRQQAKLAQEITHA